MEQNNSTSLETNSHVSETDSVKNKPKPSRKAALSRKTQKLVQAASLISSTLKSLETDLAADASRNGVPANAAKSNYTPTFVDGVNIKSIFSNEGPNGPIFGSGTPTSTILSSHRVASAKSSNGQLYSSTQNEQQTTRIATVETKVVTDVSAYLEEIKLLKHRIQELEFKLAAANSEPISTTSIVNETTTTTTKSQTTRIAALEQELATVYATTESSITMYKSQILTLQSKCVSLEVSNADLKSQLSRMNAETSSLTDQNEILRTENRRLQDEESKLRQKIFELSSTNQKRNSESVSSLQQFEASLEDAQLKQRVIANIDQKLRDVSDRVDKYNTSSSLSVNTAHKHIVLKRLETISTSFQTLKRFANAAGVTMQSLPLLSICAELTQLLTYSFTDTCESYEESLDIDMRIEKLRTESVQVRQETERTISEMRSRYEHDINEAKQEGDVLRGRVEGLNLEIGRLNGENDNLRKRSVRDSAEDYNAVKRDNDLLQTRLEGLIRDLESARSESDRLKSNADGLSKLNKELLETVQLKEAAKEKELEDDGAISDDGHSQYRERIQVLELMNHSLKSHIAYLEGAIAEWKLENSKLTKSLQRLETERVEKNAETTALSMKLHQADSALQIETLEVKKAHELIKSLKTQLRASSSSENATVLFEVDAEAHRMESAFNEQVNRMKTRFSPVPPSHVPQNTAASSTIDNILSSSISGDAVELGSILRVIKESDSTSEQLSKFGAAIEDVIKQTAELKEENASLEERLEQMKAKTKVRETAWLEKTKELRIDYDKCVEDCEKMDRMLANYEQQYKTTLVFAQGVLEGVTPTTHPFPFSQIISNAMTQHKQSNDLNKSLKHRIDELQKDLDAKANQLSSQAIVSETISVLNQQQKEEIQGLQRQIDVQMRKMDQLKREAQNNDEARQFVEAKIRKVVTAYCEMLDKDEPL